MPLLLTPPQQQAVQPSRGVRESRRTGKIARLPKATRDMINHMLDDGLPYHVIIDELGEAGEGLNTQNLTNWKQGGYQDYLEQQAFIDRSVAQIEAASEILKICGDMTPAKIYRACELIAAGQCLDVLLDDGEASLRKALAKNPACYLTLLNSICNLANSGRRYDQAHDRAELASALAAQTTPDQAKSNLDYQPGASSPLTTPSASAEGRALTPLSAALPAQIKPDQGESSPTEKIAIRHSPAEPPATAPCVGQAESPALEGRALTPLSAAAQTRIKVDQGESSLGHFVWRSAPPDSQLSSQETLNSSENCTVSAP